MCRYEYDLPIFALDIVSRNGAITLAVVDACPVRPRQQLPPHYIQVCCQIGAPCMVASSLSSHQLLHICAYYRQDPHVPLLSCKSTITLVSLGRCVLILEQKG